MIANDDRSMSWQSPNGFPSFSILVIISDPLLDRPILNHLDPANGPLAVFRRDVTALPAPFELLGDHRCGSRSQEGIDHEIAHIARRKHELPQKFLWFLRWMRGLLVHPIAGCRNLYDILRFCSTRMRFPGLVMMLPLPVLTGLGLWMHGVLQGMSAVGRAHRVDVPDELSAFAKVQHTLV